MTNFNQEDMRGYGGNRGREPDGGKRKHKTTTANEVLNRAASRIRGSSFIIPIFVVFLLICLGSVVLTIEDIYTTYLGYLQLETSDGFSITPAVVAILLWAGQIASMYIFASIRDDEDFRRYAKFAIAVFLLCAGLDIYTDVVYRLGNGYVDGRLLSIAVAQSIGIFTIGSEVASMVGFGMTFYLIPYTWIEIKTMNAKARYRLNKILSEIEKDDY